MIGVNRDGQAAENHLEVWGGIECTVARIGSEFRNQCAEVSHHLHELDAIAALGIKTLRYPVLLETIAPDSFDDADWSWHDERLGHLQRLGVRVIATLCHHGSGPRYTNLLDPSFPEYLARHAARVAERYPWIDLYTPVNEPLTTARFSALYGHWYPHAAKASAFLQALLTECKATVLSMRAIRQARADAQLVQTEDLGYTFSTAKLGYQADYENERRWLTFDLLCGRVDQSHPMRRSLRMVKIPDTAVDFFRDGDGTPDIIGINHYLTSDRYLDDRVGLYPAHHHGGNQYHAYADLEAVRMELPAEWLGPAARLREAWERYRLPIAVTEAHHGCTREEQLRWLMEVWNAANTVKSEGADIRAVTVWALLGCMDWNTLLTQKNGHYEPGAFDMRTGKARPTAIAKLTQSLANTGGFDHPVLDQQGWWHRHERFYVKPTEFAQPTAVPVAGRSLLVTGATGTLGRAFSRLCQHRGLSHVVTTRRDMDICDRTSVEQALDLLRPWAVINTAGYVRVAEAERDAARCHRENADGAAHLATACAARGIPLVTFSSDLVFDGRLGRPYIESDLPNPVTVYGRSKLEAEQRVLDAHPSALVIRTSAFFGPWDEHNFAFDALRALSQGRFFMADRNVVSPTYVPDLVHAALDLLIDGEGGIRHLSNTGALSWYDFARRLALRAGLEPRLVRAVSEGAENGNTALASLHAALLPAIEPAVDRFFAEAEMSWLAQEQATAVAAQ